MHKRIIILAITVLLVISLNAFGYPGGGSIAWIKYDEAIKKSDNKLPILIFFGREKDRESLTEKLKLSFTSKAGEILYVKVVLCPDDLKAIKKLRKNENVNASDNDKLSEELQTGVKYKISALSTLLGCDCYGNVLKKANKASLKSSDKLEKLAEELKEKQKKLDADLKKRYAKAGKLFAKESKNQKFSQTVIKRLLKITKYVGYAVCLKAKSNLDEINKCGEEELNSIVEKKDDEAELETIIKELKNLQKKYKGLPIQLKAQEFIEQAESEQKDSEEQKDAEEKKKE